MAYKLSVVELRYMIVSNHIFCRFVLSILFPKAVQSKRKQVYKPRYANSEVFFMPKSKIFNFRLTAQQQIFVALNSQIYDGSPKNPFLNHGSSLKAGVISPVLIKLR